MQIGKFGGRKVRQTESIADYTWQTSKDEVQKNQNKANKAEYTGKGYVILEDCYIDNL